MKPAFSYYGGKQKIAKRIVELLPEHKCYVEPFCGSASVLFAKGYKTVSNNNDYREAINDTDGRVVNFFRVLRSDPERLSAACKMTPYSRSEHDESYVQSDDSFENARRFFCDIQQGVLNRTRSGWAMTPKPSHNHAVSYSNACEKMMIAAERLRSVHIDNVPAEKCIKQWDSKDTLFYVDPPYPSTDQGHYRGFSQADFERLIEQLSSIKGRAVLSCYPNDAVPKSWQRVEIKTNCSASSRATGKREPRTECVWITP